MALERDMTASMGPSPLEARGVRAEIVLRALRAILSAAVLVAVVYQATHLNGFSITDNFSYFTELSNIFAALMLAYCAARPAAERSATVELLRGAAVVYILTTGIVYAVLLSGHRNSYPWVNTILHRISPIALLLDWIVDPPRHQLGLGKALAWMGFPLLYIAYTLVRGAIVNWYPYFFVDPRRHGGYLLVAADCVAVGLGILALIVAMRWVGERRRA